MQGRHLQLGPRQLRRCLCSLSQAVSPQCFRLLGHDGRSAGTAAMTSLLPAYKPHALSWALRALRRNSLQLLQVCAQAPSYSMSWRYPAVMALRLHMTSTGDSQFAPHGAQLEIRRLTVAVDSLIKQVDRNGKAQRDMAAAVIAALTKLVRHIFPLQDLRQPRKGLS